MRELKILKWKSEGSSCEGTFVDEISNMKYQLKHQVINVIEILCMKSDMQEHIDIKLIIVLSFTVAITVI